jgi:hypothetical protein
MKIFFLFLLLALSLSAFAQSLPQETSPCAWGSNCIRFRKILDGIFSPPGGLLNSVGATNVSFPGVYYQRGEANNCRAAQQEAREKLLFNHPEFSCRESSNSTGIACEASNIGPRLVSGSCMRSDSGKVVAWIKCDTTRDPGPRAVSNSGAGIILIKIAQEGERKARASKIRN